MYHSDKVFPVQEGMWLAHQLELVEGTTAPCLFKRLSQKVAPNYKAVHIGGVKPHPELDIFLFLGQAPHAVVPPHGVDYLSPC